MKLTEQNFQNLISYWAGKLNLPLPLFRRDNGMKWLATIIYCKDCKAYSYCYNFKKTLELEESEIAGAVFHELGHIKYYKKRKNTIQSEYDAETFALRCLKKYYPDYVKYEIKGWKKLIKEKSWRKKYPDHAKAFDLIKEYQS